ncbi:MAG: pseudouridine synthase [Tepidanaerobacteraceae bacterium]
MNNNRMRLDKVLSMSGFGSRKDVKRLVKQGGVYVNKRHAKDPGMQVLPNEDDIKVFGEKVVYKDFIYIILNKPKGVITSTADSREVTVIDLLEGSFSHRNLFPVGRLDKDAEGLILLTDNGRLAHKLLAPKSQIEKTYYVEVDGNLDESDTQAFAKGIELDDFKALPASLKILRCGPRSAAQLTIYEGKFHQVKKMMEARGRQVTYLKRLSIGPLVMDKSLAPGEWRELTDAEIKALLTAC